MFPARADRGTDKANAVEIEKSGQIWVIFRRRSRGFVEGVDVRVKEGKESRIISSLA